MRPRFLPILLAWACIAAAHLFGEISGLRDLSLWTKTGLMPALAAWFWLETRRFWPVSPKLWVISGLLLSWLGDCLLLFQHEKTGIPWFLLGLGAFLAAHLCYLTAFLKFPSDRPSFLWKNKWLLLPFALFLLMMDGVLWPSLADGLRWPVIFYSIAITAMAVGAAQLFGKMEGRAAQAAFLGALFFICSDSILAVNKFRAPVPLAGFFIMLTYILGQFGIAFGMWRGLQRADSHKFHQ